MTTAVDTPDAPQPTAGRAGLVQLTKAEGLKIRTTNIWWILALGGLVATGLALLVNCVEAHAFIGVMLNPNSTTAINGGDELRRAVAAYGDLTTLLKSSAANIFTSGQFFGLMLVMLLGILVVTSEYFHQTATMTFLATPRRTRVIVAKFVATVLTAVAAWIITTAIDLVAGTLFFSSEGQPNHLGDWSVQRAILMNLLAYVLWAILGVGIGVLFRSQIAATLTGTLVYAIGTTLARTVIFPLIHTFLIKQDWALQAEIILPSVASTVMVTATPEPLLTQPNGHTIYTAAWWIGLLVLLGYGVLFSVIGTLITRKRDIS
jgi:ABC-type transport system involved in multi-copper enzyme maturation permease subunit